MKIFIYKLYSSNDTKKRPKYIGITKRNLSERLGGHLNTSLKNKENTHKSKWIKKLIKNGLKPKIAAIDEVNTWEEACEKEKYWIAFFKQKGYKLTNGTDGGEGQLNSVGNIKKQKSVIKFDLNGNIIQIYNSITIAAVDNNLSKAAIGKACKNETNSSGDFLWLLEQEFLIGKKPKISPLGHPPLLTILQYNKEGILLKEWNGIKTASIALKIGRGVIQECLRQRNKTGAGFIWKYKL